ncbi:MAG: tRNA pseudouridine(55) synthase TruB [Mycoplasma sp.]
MEKNRQNVFAINKPLHITSNKLIQNIKYSCKIKKIGHGGTLDPMASGVLIIGINNGTKLLNNHLNESKEYIAKIEFGYATSTYDLEGEKISFCDKKIDLENIEKICEKWSSGPFEQKVPLYSAVKINGKELYKHARDGNEVVPPTKIVEIKEYEILSFEENILEIRLLVSKGFYIRSFAYDLGIELGTFSTLIGLIRTKSGDFSIEESYTVDEFVEKYNAKKTNE